jgi:hypothetical protein
MAKGFSDFDLAFWVIFSTKITNAHLVRGRWDSGTSFSTPNPEKP